MYWAIGKMVFYVIVMALSNKGAQVGAATITGFPVTNAGTDQTISVTVINTSYPASCTNTVGILTASSTTMALWGVGSSTFTQMANTNFTNASVVQMNGFYMQP